MDLVAFCFTFLIQYCDSYQRPSTVHYVVSTEDAIVYGRHFYCTSSIITSVSGIVHAFMLGNFITNDSHDRTRTLLRRLIFLWLNYYKTDKKEGNTCKSAFLTLMSYLLTHTHQPSSAMYLT